MREIKFRFWSRVLQTLVIPADGIFVGALKDPKMIIMQYIGQKDIQGKDVYEGDILSSKMWKNQVVKWYESRSGFFGTGGADLLELVNIHNRFKVIGNIYENPELLK